MRQLTKVAWWRVVGGPVCGDERGEMEAFAPHVHVLQFLNDLSFWEPFADNKDFIFN